MRITPLKCFYPFLSRTENKHNFGATRGVSVGQGPLAGRPVCRQAVNLRLTTVLGFARCFGSLSQSDSAPKYTRTRGKGQTFCGLHDFPTTISRHERHILSDNENSAKVHPAGSMGTTLDYTVLIRRHPSRARSSRKEIGEKKNLSRLSSKSTGAITHTYPIKSKTIPGGLRTKRWNNIFKKSKFLFKHMYTSTQVQWIFCLKHSA